MFWLDDFGTTVQKSYSKVWCSWVPDVRNREIQKRTFTFYHHFPLLIDWVKHDIYKKKWCCINDITYLSAILTFFPLISPSDIVSMYKLILMLKILNECDLVSLVSKQVLLEYIITARCHQTQCDNVCLDL